LPIQVLDLDLLHVGRFQRIASLVGTIQHGIPNEVAELTLVESVAFARFDKIALQHQIRIAVDLDLETFAKLAGIIRTHDLTF
jgi:hypothetical protein